MKPIRLVWHGGASFTLDLAGVVASVDPAFSRPGDYPPWFGAEHTNRNAPTVAAFLRDFEPAYVFVTHGHFDHFDLETVRKLASSPSRPTVVGSREVREVCSSVLGLGKDQLAGFPKGDGSAPGNWLQLGGAGPLGVTSPRVRVRPVPGRHWFTGAEGSAVAAKFSGRPDRYGVMPCGGPMLGFLFEMAGAPLSRPFRIYASGDTDPVSFPRGPFDVAVVCCGGSLVNPATKRLEPPWITEASLARAAATRLRPRLLVPIHYDHPAFKTPFDPDLLGAALRAEARPEGKGPVLLTPAHGEWLTLSA